MADLGQVWKELFGREIGEDGLPVDREVVRFSVNVPGRVRERDPSGEEYEEYLREMMLFLGDLCQECRERVERGASSEDLDVRCSELVRRGMRARTEK